ncbi:MAG: hypothetical protein H6559_29815 [Lewinellaceae bacterium]|nr:hypothetical protein [Lewinellaceae bacterium]
MKNSAPMIWVALPGLFLAFCAVSMGIGAGTVCLPARPPLFFQSPALAAQQYVGYCVSGHHYALAFEQNAQPPMSHVARMVQGLHQALDARAIFSNVFFWQAASIQLPGWANNSVLLYKGYCGGPSIALAVLLRHNL